MGEIKKMEKHRILIIDDNLNIHKDFHTILCEENDTSELDAMAAEFFGEKTTKHIAKNRYDLDYATQGKNGVEKAKKALSDNKPFALAMVDMRMPPGWDGLETIEHLWEVDPDVQVVICSAYSDYSWEHIFAKTGRTDKLLILKKPFDSAEVAQLACALTEKWDLAKKANIKMKEIEQIVEKRTIELAKANKLLQIEIDEKKKTENQQGTDADSFNNIDQIRNAGITPHPPIQIEIIKTGDFGYQNIRQYSVKRS